MQVLLKMKNVVYGPYSITRNQYIIELSTLLTSKYIESQITSLCRQSFKSSLVANLQLGIFLDIQQQRETLIQEEFKDFVATQLQV